MSRRRTRRSASSATRCWLAAAALLCGSRLAAAEPLDARSIMQQVYDRDDGDQAQMHLQMVITRGGQTRERRLQTWLRKFKGGSKRLVIFEAPGDIRNSGLLTFDYDDVTKEDDQWLHLSSLHRTTRVATATKAESFMGSDFSFADITKPNPASYEFRLDGEGELVDGEACLVIDAKPADERTKKETGYVKLKYWVSKEKRMFIRAKLWVDKGHKLKFISFGELRNVSGIWTAHKITARTMQGAELESETVLSTLNVAYGKPDVTEALFSQARLEQGL